MDGDGWDGAVAVAEEMDGDFHRVLAHAELFAEGGVAGWNRGCRRARGTGPRIAWFWRWLLIRRRGGLGRVRGGCAPIAIEEPVWGKAVGGFDGAALLGFEGIEGNGALAAAGLLVCRPLAGMTQRGEEKAADSGCHAIWRVFLSRGCGSRCGRLSHSPIYA